MFDIPLSQAHGRFVRLALNQALGDHAGRSETANNLIINLSTILWILLWNFMKIFRLFNYLIFLFMTRQNKRTIGRNIL